MDCQYPLHCCNIAANEIQNEVMGPLPLALVEKSEFIDIEFHVPSQSDKQQFSSRFLDSPQPPYNSISKCYEDAYLTDTLPGLSFPERQISFSWPSSPQSKIKITKPPSLDYTYIRKHCLSNQQVEDSGRKDGVPFLLRIHSGHFHICLGLCSQTVLWKTIEEDSSFFRCPFNVPSSFSLGLWLFALMSVLLISGAYLLKCLFYFEIVQMEYCDRVRVNYLFVPWIAGMLLRLGLPSDIARNKVHPVLCCIFMIPITILDLKIYGQWFTKGKRSLARIANPSTHLSVIGNFVIARLAARVEWRETAVLFFTVGLVHYVVVFITLYQRLTPDITVSRKICPVFFLFIAAPSLASVAWEATSGSFDTFSKMLFFLALFLYSALIVRVNFFRENMRRFSVIWWACAYSMTTTSVASVKYVEEVKHFIARCFAYVLCSASVGMVLLLAVLTTVNMAVGRDRLFPIDTLLITRRKVSLKTKKMCCRSH